MRATGASSTHTHTPFSFFEEHLKTQSELLTCSSFWDKRNSERDGGGNVALCRRQARVNEGHLRKECSLLVRFTMNARALFFSVLLVFPAASFSFSEGIRSRMSLGSTLLVDF